MEEEARLIRRRVRLAASPPPRICFFLPRDFRPPVSCRLTSVNRAAVVLRWACVLWYICHYSFNS